MEWRWVLCVHLRERKKMMEEEKEEDSKGARRWRRERRKRIIYKGCYKLAAVFSGW